jgi:poly(3-hydroxybutyrate) depolymerase
MLRSSCLLVLLSILVLVNGNRLIQQKSLKSEDPAHNSSGCGKNTDLILGVGHQLTINVKDANFDFDRTYQVMLPLKYDIETPSEILFYFHGQGGTWPWSKWDTMGNLNNFITVQPLGLSENTGTKAWQTGLADKDLHHANSTCYPSTKNTCYDTCKQINMCSPCAWSTCADDGLFIQKLVQRMKEEFCID